MKTTIGYVATAVATLAALASLAAFTAVEPQVSSTRIESLAVLRTVQEMRIGSSRDPNVGFVSIVYMDVDRDGQIILFEARDRHIRVYSPAGQLVRTIGRPGQGPGEFANFAYTGVKGDTIWALVPRPNCRTDIKLFDRRGELFSTANADGVRTGLPVGVGVVMPRMMLSDGRIMGLPVCTAPSNPAAYPPAGVSDTVVTPRVLFSAAGDVVDTVGRDVRLPRPPRQQTIVVEIEGRRIPVPESFSDTALREFLPDGAYVVERRTAVRAVESSVRISRLRLAGDTAWTRSLSYSPVRNTDAVLDSTALARAKSVEATRPFAGGTASAAARIRAAMQFPAFHVPVWQAMTGADGALWLRTATTGSPLSQWILIEPNGTPRGRIGLPPSTRLMWSKGNTLWVTQTDSNDVIWLVKLRVE
jgi:hypothetical protein